MKTALPITRLGKNVDGEPILADHYHPHEILHVTSKEDIEGLLDWYSNPALKMILPDQPEARRFYMEKIRPALRWYCGVYGVEVPEWLKGNGEHGNLSHQEHADAFGSDPLEVYEFKDAKEAKAAKNSGKE